jgi:hypothetical protein
VQRIEVVRFFVLGLSLGLAGCAAGHLGESLPEAPISADLSEPNYRQIVATNIAAVFPNPQGLGALEISAVRPVSHLRGPAWLACLRIHAEGTTQEYALFIQGDRIIDQRTGVALDRCKQQAYEPFDPASLKQQQDAANAASLKQQRKAHR